jgi:hypothetical protein
MGGQARIIEEMRRFNVIDCGRRFGKTDLCEILIHRPMWDGLPIGWFSPTYKILSEAWDEISRIYAPIITANNKSEKVMRLVGGSVIEGWSLEKEGAGRSRKYAMAIIDEAARVKNLMDVFNADIRATLLDYKGAAFFPSTPKGLNDYYKLWQMAEDNPEWARWKMPTSENPYISLDEIAAMRAAMPDWVARQELDAEFLENGAFFQNVDSVCVIDNPDNPENHVNHRIIAGLDWALTEDFTRLTVICADCKRAVDWWGGRRMDYTMQRGFITSLLAKWRGVILLPERNSMGAPNIESLIADGVSVARGHDGGYGYNTTSTSKSELIMRLALAMEKQEVKLPREYADELRGYEVEITAANPKFGAPKGQHDDRVISAALAWWLCSRNIWWMSRGE